VSFGFHVGLLVITLSSLKLHTEKNVNFDTASSKCANFDKIQFFLNIHLSS